MRTLFPFKTQARQRLAPTVLLTISLGAGQAQLSTNLAPVADTALRNGLSADTSFGTSVALPSGVNHLGDTTNHVLFKFPIEAIPAGATVMKVTLQLTTLNSNQAGLGHNLFRVLNDWNETATTWNMRIAGAPWNAPGGEADVDYVASASANAVLEQGPTTNLFTSPEMLADVQLWRAEPGTNFGWILIAADEQPGSGKQIASREDAAHQPILMVDYTLPAPAPVIFDAKIVNGQIRFSFEAAAAHAYEAQFKNSLTNTAWNDLQFIPAPPVDAVMHITNGIGGNERYFRILRF